MSILNFLKTSGFTEGKDIKASQAKATQAFRKNPGIYSNDLLFKLDLLSSLICYSNVISHEI